MVDPNRFEVYGWVVVELVPGKSARMIYTPPLLLDLEEAAKALRKLQHSHPKGPRYELAELARVKVTIHPPKRSHR